MYLYFSGWPPCRSHADGLGNMKTITANSFTRVTLALDIIGKIASGPFKDYHELSAIKHGIGLSDAITVDKSSTTQIRCNNPLVPLDNKNSCRRALDAVREALSADINAAVTIDKKIPVMGGLAGGSANAATTIVLVNTLWDLGLSKERMAEIGRTVGMDVPYFFTGNTAYDTEATGILEPISTPLTFELVLVVPGFGVSTREAYQTIDYSLIGKNIDNTMRMKAALTAGDTAGVMENMHNDFELSVFKRRPELGRIKQRLIELGCANAVMSGSGSTMMGILDCRADPEKIRARMGHTTMIVSSKVNR